MFFSNVSTRFEPAPDRPESGGRGRQLQESLRALKPKIEYDVSRIIYSIADTDATLMADCLFF